MGFETPPVVIRPPEMPCFPPFVRYDEDNPFLTEKQCLRVIRVAEQKGLRPGTIGNGDNHSFKLDESYRRVRLATLQCVEDEMQWLFEIIRDRVSWTNTDFYRFDLHGVLEGVQYLRYESGDENGHYDWHQDYGGGYSSHRKLSVVIQLSDPEAYEGCRLELFTEGAHEVPTLARGTGVIFPSWQPHRVTPITRGTRRALVCWVSGPQFR